MALDASFHNRNGEAPRFRARTGNRMPSPTRHTHLCTRGEFIWTGRLATVTRLPTSYVTPCQLLRIGFRERRMDYLFLPIFVKFESKVIKSKIWKKLFRRNKEIGMKIFKDYKDCIMFYKYIGWIILWCNSNRLFPWKYSRITRIALLFL